MLFGACLCMDDTHWTVQALAVCGALWLLSGVMKNIQMFICLRKLEGMLEGPQHIMAAARWFLGSVANPKLNQKIT